MNFRLSPNPASENLQLELAAEEIVEGNLIITDLQGKEMYSKKIRGDKSTVELNIDISSWKPQLYVVTFRDNANTILMMKKVIKF